MVRNNLLFHCNNRLNINKSISICTGTETFATVTGTSSSLAPCNMSSPSSSREEEINDTLHYHEMSLGQLLDNLNFCRREKKVLRIEIRAHEANNFKLYGLKVRREDRIGPLYTKFKVRLIKYFLFYFQLLPLTKLLDFSLLDTLHLARKFKIFRWKYSSFILPSQRTCSFFELHLTRFMTPLSMTGNH